MYNRTFVIILWNILTVFDKNKKIGDVRNGKR